MSNPYTALGLPQPKKTFLDAPRKPTTDNPNPPAPRNTDAVILGEHKVELTDMLQEAISTLKNVYRSKFVFGEHLKFVDPSFTGDTVNKFNLATPPVFDPAYAQQLAPPQGGTASPTNGDSMSGGADSATKEKLRTAEELIKKLHRRNNQLEVENKYLKTEIGRHERLAGLGRTPAHTLAVYDGHLPMDNPLYSDKMKRRCRSGPPTRTLLRTHIGGYGLTFPSRNAADEDVVLEDPPAVAMLKRRVVQLTEALVTIQHENEKLTHEKVDRVTHRDHLLKAYICDRDTQIAQLHTALQELLNKVQNPMKLVRSRQPSASMSPVVATNNVLKEVSQRLSESILKAANDLTKRTLQALPASEDHPENGEGAPGGRRQELTNRLRGIIESLPVGKRKQLLLLFMELKQLYDSLLASNKSLLRTYEDHRRLSEKDTVLLKIQVASLQDQLRALGIPDEEQRLAPDGGATSAANAQAPQPSGLNHRDP